MAAIVLKIVHQQHFIKGDEYLTYLCHPASGAVVLIAAAKDENYLDMCENLHGLKARLEFMGNQVVIYNKFESDPNFETEADAEEYLRNKGE